MRLAVLIGCFLLLLSGCYSKPVRHLASDASLIKAGESTRGDVLLYLGEPDSRRSVGPETEELIYYEDKRGLLQRTPMIGSMLDAKGYELLIITLTGDIVTDTEFRTFTKGEMERFEGHTWEGIE